MLIKVLLVLIFFGAIISIGIYSRKRAKSVSDFVLGGRSIGPWMSAFAYGTSYFSAVIFVGYAGQFGWKFGIASTWIGLGNALIGSLMAWSILGRRTRVMTNHLNSATMPDFFGKRYDSKALRTVASIITFVFLIPYTASLYNGLSRIFGMAFNIDYGICVVVMAVVTCIYVVAGGYMATTVNDFIQGIIMLVGIVAVIASVLSGQGGFTEAIAKLAQVSDANTAGGTQPGVFASFFGPDPLGLLSVVILTSLGTWGLPQMVQKFYAIKSEKAISTGTIVSTAFAIVVAGGSYFLGGFGRLFSGNPAIYNDSGAVIYDSIMPTLISGLPDILIGIVVVLILSASMSTLASLVLASSSTITLDIIKVGVKNKMSERKIMLVMRIFVAVFVVVSAILALVQHTSAVTFIAQLMGISWGALAGAFLAPFLYGLYWKRTTRTAVWASFISGVGIMGANLIATLFGTPIFASPINAGAFAMLFSLVLVPVVSFLTPKMSAEHIEHAFSCYSKEVRTAQKFAIEEEKPS